jgi:Fur family ferric uptake transcriptional regulator
MRRTRQRQLVHDALVRLGPHSTADEIVAHIRRQEPAFSRSTVYRALDALVASGSVHAVRLGTGAAHYELAGEAHQHAVCERCRGVLHIEGELVSELTDHLRERHRFLPYRTEVLVIGTCDGCSTRRPRGGSGRRVLEHVHHAR